MIGFVPYPDDSDPIVDNWANILESGRSIIWEDLFDADLEGRRNFLTGGTESVQGRDRENPEDFIPEQRTSQEGATEAEQTRYLPPAPAVNESVPPHPCCQRDLQALKQIVEKMSADQESRLLQFERSVNDRLDMMSNRFDMMSNNFDMMSNRFDMLTNIMSRFVQQQTDSSKGGYRADSSGVGGEHSGGADMGINAGGDYAQDEMFAPTDAGFGTERGKDQDMEDSPRNEIFYHTPTCSSDKDREEDILDVEQQKGRPQRHLKKSKYRRTPYTDPDPKKMMFRKGSIKEFDPLHIPDSMRNSFEEYKNSVPKPPFTSGLGITRASDFFDQILTEHFWLLSDVSNYLLNNAISKLYLFIFLYGFLFMYNIFDSHHFVFCFL